MTETTAKILAAAAFAGLALTAVSGRPAFGQQAQADCRASLEAYVADRSLNASWGDTARTYVKMVRGGVVYICRCYSNTQPPDCRKEGSGGSSPGGADLSRLKPGQQVALMAAQSFLQGLLDGIFSAPSRPAGPSPEEILRQQQEALRKQEEERLKALADWKAFQDDEAKRIEAERAAARASGDALLGKMSASGGQGLGFESVGGKGLEFQAWVDDKPGARPGNPGRHPAPKSAVEQARCAAAFSDEALRLEKAGRPEDAEFMSLQAQKVMAGEPTDVPCPAASSAPAPGAAGTETSKPALDVDRILEQYNAGIKGLFEISRKLADVRKQKIDAQLDIRELEARIGDLRLRSEQAVRPEDKKQADDLLAEALALKGESETRLKIAEENENACLADAKKAEEAVRELDAKIKKGPEGR